MEIDKKILEQLAKTMERKVMTDEMKVIDKQIRNLGKRIRGLNENISIDQELLVSIHNGITGNITELKKVLKANGLL